MAETKNTPHIAVIAFPFGSHAAQILNLTRRLAAAAPEATFSFFSTAKSNRSIFGSSSDGYDNIKAYDNHDGVPDDYQLTYHEEEIDLFFKAMPNNFKEGMDTAVADSKKPVTCVMNDAFVWVAAEIAEELGVPWITVWAPGASALCTHFYTDIIRQKFAIGGTQDEALSFIPGMSKVHASDLQDVVLNGDLESLFARVLHKAGQILPRATAVAINSFEELEQTIIDNLKTKFQKCLAVGPFTLICPSTNNDHNNLEDPSDCLSWLDGRERGSVAYISFGTLATPPPGELAALAEGIEASGVPFIWSLKDRVKVHLPNGFLERTSERGMVVPWTPQSKLLENPAVGVIVTHCGWNSVLESIMGAVPIIYRPFFGDHFLIGRFVSDVWEIGVSAGGDGVFSKDGVMNALDVVLNKEEGKKIKAKVEALKLVATNAVGPSGSTTKNLSSLLEIITSHRK